MLSMQLVEGSSAGICTAVSDTADTFTIVVMYPEIQHWPAQAGLYISEVPRQGSYQPACLRYVEESWKQLCFTKAN